MSEELDLILQYWMWVGISGVVLSVVLTILLWLLMMVS